jgi:RNA polymerase sigma factor (TIGR02999 family)
MAIPPSNEITQLLRAWSDGDQAALDELSSLVQAELRRLARRYLAGERPGHSLQATALINEVWLRLIDWKNVSWQNRAHFFAVSAQLMRRILVDYARRRPHINRVGDAQQVSLDQALEFSAERSSTLIALDDALDSLAALDQRKVRIVELRFFGGLSEEETAEVLGVSSKTVQREWIKAKAWLYSELSGGKADDA